MKIKDFKIGALYQIEAVPECKWTKLIIKTNSIILHGKDIFLVVGKPVMCLKGIRGESNEVYIPILFKDMVGDMILYQHYDGQIGCSEDLREL
jgi:hypothetical protein